MRKILFLLLIMIKSTSLAQVPYNEVFSIDFDFLYSDGIKCFGADPYSFEFQRARYYPLYHIHIEDSTDIKEIVESLDSLPIKRIDDKCHLSVDGRMIIDYIDDRNPKYVYIGASSAQIGMLGAFYQMTESCYNLLNKICVKYTGKQLRY